MPNQTGNNYNLEVVAAIDRTGFLRFFMQNDCSGFQYTTQNALFEQAKITENVNNPTENRSVVLLQQISSFKEATSDFAFHFTKNTHAEQKSQFQIHLKHGKWEPDSVHGLLEGCNGLLRPKAAMVKVYTHFK